jgi:uncharacterized caspase-like protein
VEDIMSRIRFGAVVVALLLMVAPASAAKRVALVVGNTRYTNIPILTNPANDARDVADALKSLGFEVLLGLDLDKRGFDLKVRDFALALGDADAAVFFYAGHGMQVAGQNYLIPVDAKIESERDLDFDVVRLDLVLKQMELDRDGKTSIVFLDACRDNPFTETLARSMGSRGIAIGRGLAEVQTGVGTFIAFSTQPGNVAADGSGRNSPFAGALKRHIADHGQNLTSLMIAVRKDVLAATQGKQVPWDHSALLTDFYFDPTVTTGTTTATSGSDADAIKHRLQELEDEVKKRSDPQRTANVVKLAQLRERLHQLERSAKDDQQRIFDTYQKYRTASTPDAKTAENREVGAILIEMARRGEEQKSVREEIAKLEADLGLGSEATK